MSRGKASLEGIAGRGAAQSAGMCQPRPRTGPVNSTASSLACCVREACLATCIRPPAPDPIRAGGFRGVEHDLWYNLQGHAPAVRQTSARAARGAQIYASQSEAFPPPWLERLQEYGTVRERRLAAPPPGSAGHPPSLNPQSPALPKEDKQRQGGTRPMLPHLHRRCAHTHACQVPRIRGEAQCPCTGLSASSVDGTNDRPAQSRAQT
jgi:hypothetical protein